MDPFEPARPWWMLPPGRIRWTWWVALLVPLLWIDYTTGVYRQFPFLYVIPALLAAWYSGRLAAVVLALAVPLAQLVFAAPLNGLGMLTLLGATFRAVVIMFMALWVARLGEYDRELYQEVQALKGLLPICSFCKNIRNESGEWENLERYIGRHSATTFSHGICPSCQAIHYNVGESSPPS